MTHRSQPDGLTSPAKGCSIPVKDGMAVLREGSIPS